MERLATVKPLGHDFTLRVPHRNRHWYEGDGYEPLSASIFGTACSAADVVIDIGAHVGFFSLLAASSNPDARVVAVEASPQNAAVLKENLALNGMRNVDVVNAAFSDSAGSVWLEVTEASDNCGLAGHPDSPTIERVRVPSIDGAALHVDAAERLVIKVDVEGYEPAALDGLRDVMTAADEVRLLIEFNPRCLRAAGTDPREVLDRLRALDLRIFALHDLGHRWQEVKPGDDDPTQHAQAGYLNLWCVPPKPATSLSVVVHSAALSGAERSHVEFCRDLIVGGRLVHTVLPEPDQRLGALLKATGSTVSVVKRYPWWAVPADIPEGQASPEWKENLSTEEVVSAISDVDPDVVVTQSVVVPQGATAATILDKPHVWWLREFGDRDHGLRLPLPPQELGAVIRALSNGILCNSHAVREHYFPGEPGAASVVSPVPAGRSPGTPIRRISDRFSVGVVGSLQPGKGHEDAIRAVALLEQEGLLVELVCVGRGVPADLNRLQTLAQQLEVSDRIFYTGEVTEDVDFFASMDVLALTSRAEAYGRVALEAARAGVPIVYAASGGLTEYMTPDQTGLAYQPGSPEKLAWALRRLIESAELREHVIDEARKMEEALRADPARLERLFSALDAAVASKGTNPLTASLIWALQGAQMSHSAVERVQRERDDALEAGAATYADLNEARRELDEALNRLDGALAGQERAIAERDEMNETLRIIQSGRSWRWAAQFRQYRSLVSRRQPGKD